jgi:transcriptional regulator with XRE-family HTH domain/Zn-dependent peptidase ImmA (M78 family)
MIKNQLQHKVSTSNLRKFEAALESASAIDQPPAGIHPLMWKAQLDGMESQIATLRREISEYQELISGDVETIEVDTLEELPAGLIMARIAKGLTQKQLAELINVKPQQIQRWEDSDYYKTSFETLIGIAKALEISVSEKISFQREAKSNAKLLSEAGIDLKFLKRRFAPQSGNAAHEIINEAAAFLRKVWGVIVRPNGELDLSDLHSNGAALARFKLPKNADEKKVRAYAQYAFTVAATVSAAEATVISAPIAGWSETRTAIQQYGEINLKNCLEYAWDLGIPVIPLSDSVLFHGCCWKIGGRNVIILKQSVRAESRWLFDLLHEMYHAFEPVGTESFSPNQMDGTAKERRESDEEMAANDFAGNVLLDGKAREYFDEVLRASNGKIAFVKRNVQRVSHRHGVNVGILANYVAYRLKRDLDADWWGAATNLQADSEDAYEITQSVFRQRFDLSSLKGIDKQIVDLATTEPSI